VSLDAALFVGVQGSECVRGEQRSDFVAVIG